MKQRINIAIDGPAAAGKSTVAKLIARRLSYVYIDTGAMYRALTYRALQCGVDVHDEQALLSLLRHTHIELQPSPQGQLVFVNGEDVTDIIRGEAVTNAVSFVAQHPLVREEMVARQRAMAKGSGVVMDGRDIGTNVLPNAEVKIFLKASVEERARRRHEENIARGFPSDFETLKEEIARRDRLDSERETAPLRKAPDAVEIDTTSLSVEEVAARIMEVVNERIG
ncbi:(d)CMP kinase [Geobacillus stearothermophilus]|uniref:(d)CMP kinase n=1 Tax=Geobacillus stearothermophilus TaxID=1422 RepID=UPI002E1EE589|nr:(d)CMP kinase [Geobacillus stearothermophilus]MED3730238.1 (d)CMP kinase [Geobacillus stearothermophilus]MED3733630.1 (d)CMP kinase [Geobacillus stearothermophilus]MED3740696.1 (d)CMP kinase [Geobacillus stearothermophilus]MED3756868.1 (d)CMP kinase [Geobacillus stearothermophilus]MED3767366.1 (d)CMP kinase [Geobacillus stearothermophilus]